MRLWTIQPEEVCKMVERGSAFRCDIAKSQFADTEEIRRRYRWLAGQMKKRIGAPPTGVEYPVWCLVERPDLRKERWRWGGAGRHGLMEIEVPASQAVVSDFDEWGIVLNGGIVSFTEAENEALWRKREGLRGKEAEAFLSKNWERIFDPTPMDNGWARRWADVQATIWEIRPEMLKGVKYFDLCPKKAS